MTNLDDLDRSLGDFLADGPNTAPEAPVIAALAHARTTSRRPDLLLRLRSDAMAHSRPSRMGWRPALVLAAIALVVTSFGVAVVGSRISGPSIVPPGPSGVPGPVTSPVPSPVPSTGPFSADVPMIVAAGGPLTVRVTDTTGELISAQSLQTGDGMSVDPTTIQIEPDPADANALVVTWTGAPCETVGLVTVDEIGHLLSIGRQGCTGDATGFDRVLRLAFSSPAAADAWSSTFVEGPAPTGPTGSATTGGPLEPLGSPAVTPVRVVLVDENGSEVAVDVVDESGRLVTAMAGVPSDGVPVDAFDATNDAPAVLRLLWPGKPCDTVLRLTIDAALSNLTLDAPQCHGDSILVDRSMILTFRDAVDARSLSTNFFAGRGGVDMPTWTMIAPDAADGTYRVRLRDPGYLVEALDGYFDPERGSTGVGADGYTFDQVDASNLRLVWLGPSCATEFDLILDRTGDTWVLWSAPCETSTTVLRMFDVGLKGPRTAPTIKFEARVGEPRG